jgi:hypothetical protein
MDTDIQHEPRDEDCGPEWEAYVLEQEQREFYWLQPDPGRNAWLEYVNRFSRHPHATECSICRRVHDTSNTSSPWRDFFIRLRNHPRV